MTTVSSMVVVKSTKPTYVTESSEVFDGLIGFSNLCGTLVGSISFSCVGYTLLGVGMSSDPSSLTVNVGTNIFFFKSEALVGLKSPDLIDLARIKFKRSSSASNDKPRNL